VTSLGINPGVYLFAGTEDAAMFRWSLQVGVGEQKAVGAAHILLNAYPNPARIHTSIHYTVMQQGPVQITLYDVQGCQVRTLVAAEHDAGAYSVVWNHRDAYGCQVAAGVYICRMTTATEVSTHKVVLCE
jgi:hypothetical protein